MSDEQWITATEAGRILKMTPRNAHRHTDKEGGSITTRRAGRRVLFARADVLALADELAVDVRPTVAPLRTDVVPPSELLDYLRERDRQLDEAQKQLGQALYRIGQLDTELAQARKALEDAQASTPAPQRRPWWKRLFE